MTLQHQLTAAHIVAKALTDLFPKVLILLISANELGFECHVKIDPSLNNDYLPQLEERYRALTCESLPIEMITMLRSNAIDWLKHLKQTHLAKLVDKQEGKLIEMCRIGDYINLSSEPLLGFTQEVACCKLLSIENGSVKGIAAKDKQALKELIKEKKEAEARDYRVRGMKEHYFCPSSIDSNQWIWLPKGVELKELCRSWLQSQLKKRGFEKIETPGITKEEMGIEAASLLTNHTKFPIHWVEWKNRNQDLELIFCRSEQLLQELISSLQFIQQTITIFNFEPQWILYGDSKKSPASRYLEEALEKALKICDVPYEKQRGGSHHPRAEMQIKNAYRERLSCGYVECDLTNLKVASRQDLAMIVSSFFGSVEHFVALCIENDIDMRSVMKWEK